MEAITPTVYLIDDDERVSRSLARLLAGERYQVSLHASAEDFLAYHDPTFPAVPSSISPCPEWMASAFRSASLRRGRAAR